MEAGGKMHWLPSVSCTGPCKYTMMMGGGCGAIPVLVLMAVARRLQMSFCHYVGGASLCQTRLAVQDASMLHRLLFVFYILLFGLVSLEARSPDRDMPIFS